MNEQQPTFLDRKTILAFVLVIAFWFGWSKFMETKYPKPQVDPAVATTTTDAANPAVPGTASAPAAPVQAGATDVPAAQQGPAEETFIAYDDASFGFQISSKGMGLKNVVVKNYSTRAGAPIVLGDVKSQYPFSTAASLTGIPVDFKIEKVSDDTFVGLGEANGVAYEKTMKIVPSTYTIETTLKLTTPQAQLLGVTTTLADALQSIQSGGFLSMGASLEHQDWFILHDGDQTRAILQKDKGGDLAQSNVAVTALSLHYFALAVVDKSDLLARFESKIPPNADVASGRLIHQAVNPTNEFVVKYVGFAGPKSFDLLSRVDAGLAKVVDYGMFAVIAKPILWLLQYLFTMLGNWGVAIIVLTIIVRLIVLPFNVFSYKSMKAMQKVQPEMNRIKEKYKDADQNGKMEMNREIMKLMKDNNANPIGGCLPMLLQLPVFIALYAVLGQSIELYRAPFGLWIHDLSAKDPFYVLPVLMAITMFVQQKITPTTMDPQQAKILMWMPVIFAFFMLALPSGLTLYIFVSTLFGIIQQYVFMRDSGAAKAVKAAKA